MWYYADMHPSQPAKALSPQDRTGRTEGEGTDPETISLDQLIEKLKSSFGDEGQITQRQHGDGSSEAVLTVEGGLRASWRGQLAKMPPLDGKTPRGPKEYYGLEFFPPGTPVPPGFAPGQPGVGSYPLNAPVPSKPPSLQERVDASEREGATLRAEVARLTSLCEHQAGQITHLSRDKRCLDLLEEHAPLAIWRGTTDLAHSQGDGHRLVSVSEMDGDGLTVLRLGPEAPSLRDALEHFEPLGLQARAQLIPVEPAPPPKPSVPPVNASRPYPGIHAMHQQARQLQRTRESRVDGRPVEPMGPAEGLPLPSLQTAKAVASKITTAARQETIDFQSHS